MQTAAFWQKALSEIAPTCINSSCHKHPQGAFVVSIFPWPLLAIDNPLSLLSDCFINTACSALKFEYHIQYRLFQLWWPADSTKFFFFPLLNNEVWDHMPVRISETLVSCRDLIRRQHQWLIALPLLRYNRCAGSSHQSNYVCLVCIQHVHMLLVLKHASALLHPLALYLGLPVELLPKPVKKGGDEVQEYMSSHSYLYGGDN